MPHFSSATASAPRLSPAAAFPALALVLFAFFFASSAPSPLYVVFQHQWGFSPYMITVAYAIYAIALLATLLVAGSLSDHIGRRPVVFAALVVQAGAMTTFVLARDVGGLLMARVLQGIAMGMASGALSAAVIEAAPAAKKTLGARISSTSPIAGLAVGALLTGFVAKLSAHPALLVFGTLTLVFVAAMVLLFFVPESAAKRPGALASLVPSVAVPLPARAAFVRGVPVCLAVWSLGALFFALSPSLLREVFLIDNGIFSGLPVALMCSVGAVTPGLLTRIKPEKAVAIGMACIAAGLLLLMLSLQLRLLPLFFVASAIAGAGFGGGHTALVQVLAPLVDTGHRGQLFSALFVVCYIATSIPVMLAGALMSRFGLLPVVEVFCGLMVASALAGAWLHWRTLAVPARA